MRKLLYSVVALSSALNCEVVYELYHGAEVNAHIYRIAELMQDLFYDYPNLYHDDHESIDELADQLIQFCIPGAVLIVARNEARIIGAIIGIPAEESAKKYKDLMVQHDAYTPKGSMYAAEFLVERSYQRKGIGRTLMQLFEQVVGETGYTDIYLLSVVRSENHPMQPPSSTDSCTVWDRLGFKQTNIAAPWAWLTRIDPRDEKRVALIDNMMGLWHKQIKVAQNLRVTIN